jgi:DNA-binding NarL/FixJ family response regulator
MTIRVAIADDQAMVRRGFRLLLEDEPDMAVVAEAGDGETAEAAVRRFDPDVALMDIRMPGTNGLEATRRLAGDPDLRTRILILTTFDLDEYVFEALRAGAAGFLLKEAPPEQLIDAVRTIAAGDALLGARVTRRVIEAFRAAARTRRARARAARADRARGRRPAPARAGAIEPRDRGRAVRQRDHREDPRRPHPRQARPAGPRAGGDLRLRERARPARRLSPSGGARWEPTCYHPPV